MEFASAAAPITAAAFTPDGKQVVTGSQAGIEIRSWPKLETAGRLATALEHVHDLKFSPDGKTLLAAGGSPGETGVVEVWMWGDETPREKVSAPADVIYRAAWSPDGSRFAAAEGDGVCRVFEAKSLKQVAKYEGHSRPVLAIAFLPDGETIVSAGIDQTVRLWEADSGKHLRTLDNHLAAVNDLAVRPGAKVGAPPIVATCGEDRTVRLWQPTIGRLMRFARLPSIPRVIAWSPDGTQLLVGANDGRLRVLDPETMEVLTDSPGLDGRMHVLLVAEPAGRALIAGEGVKGVMTNGQ